MFLSHRLRPRFGKLHPVNRWISDLSNSRPHYRNLRSNNRRSNNLRSNNFRSNNLSRSRVVRRRTRGILETRGTTNHDRVDRSGVITFSMSAERHSGLNLVERSRGKRIIKVMENLRSARRIDRTIGRRSRERGRYQGLRRARCGQVDSLGGW
jgi:hypothetical protein